MGGLVRTAHDSAHPATSGHELKLRPALPISGTQELLDIRARGTLPVAARDPPIEGGCNGYTLADSVYSNGENIRTSEASWDSEDEISGFGR